MSEDGGAARTYVLGHAHGELQRLGAQARLVDPITRRFLSDAGIGAGMRVLDVGSGVGHVSFLAADLVGVSGEVLGVDLSATAIETATRMATARSLPNVSFREGDPGEMVFERPFDAAIGRYVLQFQAKPAAMLRKLAALVRPGGVVVFHELDWSGVRSVPSVPTFDRCCGWLEETLRLGRAETGMGMKLHPTFVAAGLAEPSMRMEALIGGGSHSSDLLQKVVDLVHTLSSEMQRLGVATVEEVDADSLFDRMTSEVLDRGAVVVGHLQVGCWSRV